jgi:hypothetical protein
VVSFAADTETSAGKKPTAFIGDEIHFRQSARIRFLISVKDAPPGSIVSLISNGQAIRSLSTTEQLQAIEVQCDRNAYFRLEVRDSARAMLALTNPIFIKVR